MNGIQWCSAAIPPLSWMADFVPVTFPSPLLTGRAGSLPIFWSQQTNNNFTQAVIQSIYNSYKFNELHCSFLLQILVFSIECTTHQNVLIRQYMPRGYFFDQFTSKQSRKLNSDWSLENSVWNRGSTYSFEGKRVISGISMYFTSSDWWDEIRMLMWLL